VGTIPTDRLSSSKEKHAAANTWIGHQRRIISQPGKLDYRGSDSKRRVMHPSTAAVTRCQEGLANCPRKQMSQSWICRLDPHLSHATVRLHDRTIESKLGIDTRGSRD